MNTEPFRTKSRWLRRERNETELLLRNIPPMVLTLFVVSVIGMNLLAGKTLLQTEWIALDGGILLSWLSFLCMDLVTRYFGSRAANRMVVLATGIHLLVCLIFHLASRIPSKADDYTAWNRIFGGTWIVLLGSTVAFLTSAFLNNFLNRAIGHAFRRHPDGRLAYAVPSFVSTFVGQFADNLIFSLIVFVWLAPTFWNGFHWTVRQCIVCALTGAVAELMMEMLFAPLGYRILRNWKQHRIGREYLDQINGGTHP